VRRRGGLSSWQLLPVDDARRRARAAARLVADELAEGELLYGTAMLASPPASEGSASTPNPLAFDEIVGDLVPGLAGASGCFAG
jgi:hypothetical protein